MPRDQGAAAPFDRGDHGPASEDRGQRHVAGAESLPHGHEVRRRVPVLHGQKVTAAPNPGHDLVGNEQDVMSVADLTEALVVARRGYDGTASCTDDRLYH